MVVLASKPCKSLSPSITSARPPCVTLPPPLVPDLNLLTTYPALCIPGSLSLSPCTRQWSARPHDAEREGAWPCMLKATVQVWGSASTRGSRGVVCPWPACCTLGDIEATSVRLPLGGRGSLCQWGRVLSSPRSLRSSAIHSPVPLREEREISTVRPVQHGCLFASGRHHHHHPSDARPIVLPAALIRALHTSSTVACSCPSLPPPPPLL